MHICSDFLYNFFFVQVENLNPITNLEYYYYYDMLITCKCMTFCEQLHCDAKNESPNPKVTN